MDWYKWVFDGVGGAAAVALCAWFLGSRTKSKKSDHPAIVIKSSQIDEGTNITQHFEHHDHHYQSNAGVQLRNTQPTPAQIWEDLRGVVPFDQAHAKKKYVGIPVLWNLRLNGISDVILEKHSRLVHAYFVPDSKDEYEWNEVGFEMTEVPALLKAAPWASVLWVRGTISRVDSIVILSQNPEIVKIERPIATLSQPAVIPAESIGEKSPQIENTVAPPGDL